MVRDVAKAALAEMLPKRADVVERAIEGDTLHEKTVRFRPRERDASYAIWMFETYVDGRVAGIERLRELDLEGPTIAYITRWSTHTPEGLDAIELAAAEAIGAVARFLEIPPQHAGAKAMSYRDTKARVARYRALIEARDQTEE